jgi:hypothetical protein
MDVSDLLGGKYLSAANIPHPVEVTISGAGIEQIPEDNGDMRDKLVVHFSEKGKGMVINKTNLGMLSHLFGTDTDKWIGKKLILKTEPVQFGPKMVDALRLAPVPTPVPSGRPSKKTVDDEVPF